MTKPEKKKRKPTPSAWKKGKSGNPKGRRRLGEEFVARAAFILSRMPVGELIDRVSAIRMPVDKMTPEQKKLNRDTRRMASQDLTIMMRIADAFKSEGGAGLERLLDRLIGTPTQTINQVNLNATAPHTLPVSATQQFLMDTFGVGKDKPLSEPGKK